jgi:hypothetical protein
VAIDENADVDRISRRRESDARDLRRLALPRGDIEDPALTGRGA